MFWGSFKLSNKVQKGAWLVSTLPEHTRTITHTHTPRSMFDAGLKWISFKISQPLCSRGDIHNKAGSNFCFQTFLLSFDLRCQETKQLLLFLWRPQVSPVSTVDCRFREAEVQSARYWGWCLQTTTLGPCWWHHRSKGQLFRSVQVKSLESCGSCQPDGGASPHFPFRDFCDLSLLLMLCWSSSLQVSQHSQYNQRLYLVPCSGLVTWWRPSGGRTSG